MLTHHLLSTLLRATRLFRAEQGFATLAVGVAAFLATATTAATLAIADGSFEFDGLEDMMESSAGRVGSTLEVRGSIVAQSKDGACVSVVQLPVRLFGEGSQVSFDAASPERVLIAYYDEDAYFPDATYAIEMLTGDGDNQLEAWETMLITVELPPGQLVGGERFTLELSASVGGTVIVQRTLPPILQPVMSLY